MKPTQKLAKIIRNTRVIIMLVSLFIALLLISPVPWINAAAITEVERDSPAMMAGIPVLDPETRPIAKERIVRMVHEGISYQIRSEQDYHETISILSEGDTVTLHTKRGSVLWPEENSYRIILERITQEEVFDEEQNETIIIEERVPIGYEEIGLGVGPVATNNIRLGIELAGGTRVLIALQERADPEVYESLVDNIRERLNVFGLSDIVVRPSTDLAGDQYILVELAGINNQDIARLLEQQGEFEARIGDTTVFTGGENDIRYICRSAQCSGIDPQAGCRETALGWTCGFRFEISLSTEAAQRQADATRDLAVISDGFGGSYLSENLSLILDGEVFSELRISSGLRGRAETSILISGSGSGNTRQDAIQNALSEMRALQTVMETGSLPVELEIVRVDTISPSLGAEFVRNSLIVGLTAIIAVVTVLSLIYRRIIISIPIISIAVTEVVLILGVAALISWNLDLASIAGIIVAIGTGVDDQIVITDEAMRKDQKKHRSWKDRIRAAFFIIMGAYFTTMAAMIPLMTAGAGMLRGFALTTMIGVTIGVLITRPAFGIILESLLGEKE
ncbi:MAG: MMPL family transporter [Candidatus Woesearchaeota archaeon]